jgi:hypothetical protein
MGESNKQMFLKFEQEWYTPKEVGAIIKKSEVSVVKMFENSDGVFDAACGHENGKHHRRHLRISAAALERFLRERMTKN